MTEVPKALELMSDLRSKTQDVINHTDNILKKAKEGQFDTSKVNRVKYQISLIRQYFNEGSNATS